MKQPNDVAHIDTPNKFERQRELKPPTQGAGMLDWLGSRPSTASLGSILLIVGAVSLLMQAIVFFASDLIVTPDSAGYISLAEGIVKHFDFRQEYFQFRTPAYPLFLAIVFKLFGNASAIALPCLQHIMVVGSVLLTCLIAYELKPSRSFALIAGLIAAGGFHFGVYANAVLTETPYALMVMVCVYYCTRHMTRGSCQCIILASIAAGLATLIRPSGQGLILVCVGVAGLRSYYSIPLLQSDVNAPSNRISRSKRQTQRPAFRLAIAVLPAMMIVGPWMCYKAALYGRFELSYAGNMAYYLRAVVHDGVDPSGFPGYPPIQLAIENAKQDGYISKDNVVPDYYMAVSAYQYTYNTSLSNAAYAVGEVGRQMMIASPIRAIARTPLYAYRTYFMPDNLYRFLPEGIPGQNGKLAKKAILFASDSYTESVTSRVGYDTMHAYFPVQPSKVTAITRLWASFCTWYRTRIELGDPLLGLLDTPYEEMMALALLGGVISLLGSDRWLYLSLGCILAYHTVVTSFYGGTLPRYIVPVSGLLSIFVALPINLAYEICTSRLRMPKHERLPNMYDAVPL